ncbi:hypothetical protein [Saccharopolyspora spinosa]|uniref:Uncharacterized protein n=1 Tax=Saccharopolyspora spinosa TaxID=60894 RepID=A0A2N3Y244_SACSN|nr:hypothetical protein [Saccharopolyspora spinosa]PKW16970.1 hypothetical protein A8926_4883 [Saccharopolyspora spinosa]
MTALYLVGTALVGVTGLLGTLEKISRASARGLAPAEVLDRLAKTDTD